MYGFAALSFNVSINADILSSYFIIGIWFGKKEQGYDVYFFYSYFHNLFSLFYRC